MCGESVKIWNSKSDSVQFVPSDVHLPSQSFPQQSLVDTLASEMKINMEQQPSVFGTEAFQLIKNLQRRVHRTWDRDLWFSEQIYESPIRAAGMTLRLCKDDSLWEART